MVPCSQSVSLCSVDHSCHRNTYITQIHEHSMCPVPVQSSINPGHVFKGPTEQSVGQLIVAGEVNQSIFESCREDLT